MNSGLIELLLINLLQNVMQRTRPSTTVRIAIRREGQVAVLSVEVNGRGA